MRDVLKTLDRYAQRNMTRHHSKGIVTAHWVNGIGEEDRRIIGEQSIEQGTNSPP